ncbi:MAG: TIGR04552 family protein [Oligoflexia bacterium]|nr:TIGR04552 family protein [Oligoflexia bacterium]
MSSPISPPVAPRAQPNKFGAGDAPAGPGDDDVITLNSSIIGLSDDFHLDLADLEAVRLVLRGNSVVDWNRASFTDLESVNHYLLLHRLSWDDPEDRRRVTYLHSQAIGYLEDHLGLRFPDEIKRPEDVRQVFLMASQMGGFRRRQILACAALKLMHTIAHLEAAELRHQSALSEADLLELAERRIHEAAQKMRDEGFPIVAFYGNRKSRNSTITKLLAKKEATAALVFDKLRFRLITETRAHIVPAIAWLTRNLMPFNYVIPGQSHNNLVDMHAEWSKPPYRELADQLHGFTAEGDQPFNEEDNPFSGKSYRVVNFIVDFPVRIDHLGHARYGAMLGRVVFVLIEFQVVDAKTAEQNELGDAAHELYKERQRAIVASRLRKGGRYKRKRVTRATRRAQREVTDKE